MRPIPVFIFFRVVSIIIFLLFILFTPLSLSQQYTSQGEAWLKELPLIEVPPKGDRDNNVLAVLLTGDGGWRKIDQEIAHTLATNGIPVVGLNTLKYFWKRRTPEEASFALEQIIENFLRKWKKEEVILVGYCFGADLLPFLANRISSENLEKVVIIALIGPGHMVDFKFHPTYWLGGESAGNPRPVLPEVEKLSGKKILCFCGEEENNSLCREMKPSLAKVIVLPGGHHFGGNYKVIAETILQFLD